jgi:hypothetical protein
VCRNGLRRANRIPHEDTMDDHDLHDQPTIVKSAMRLHAPVASQSVILCAVTTPGGKLLDETALLAARTSWTAPCTDRCRRRSRDRLFMCPVPQGAASGGERVIDDQPLFKATRWPTNARFRWPTRVTGPLAPSRPNQGSSASGRQSRRARPPELRPYHPLAWLRSAAVTPGERRQSITPRCCNAHRV